MAKDFESLVNSIQSVSDTLKNQAMVVINRNVTARAWLTGYYIVEYEQNGEDRAQYGEKLLKNLADKLDNSFSVETLKKNRRFYQAYPELSDPIAGYLINEFGKGESVITRFNPPIGILMCTEIGKEMAEYVTSFTDPQLFISKYQLNLPPKEKILEFLKRENQKFSKKQRIR